MKKFKRWGLILLAVYLAGGAAIYFLQDNILFRPVSLKPDHRFEFSIPYQDISIAISSTETLNLIHFFGRDSTRKGLVLYFHGNKKNISWYARFPPYFTKHGYDVMMIDYPGYGKSKGKFSEKNINEWAEQVYRYATSQISSDSVIIYGKSMGTGIAARLASRHPARRLILETPYYDFPSVLKQYLPFYPVHWMLNYQFPTNRYIPLINIPITIFQGTRDRIVTYRNAKKLAPLLKSTDEFITVKGGRHNDLFNHDIVVNKLDSLLNL